MHWVCLCPHSRLLLKVGDVVKYHMLTTVDNPYNPFTHYDEWDSWDQDAGYCTSQFLARVARTSSELSETDQDLAIEEAIEEIVTYNVSGMHTKVPAPAGFVP